MHQERSSYFDQYCVKSVIQGSTLSLAGKMGRGIDLPLFRFMFERTEAMVAQENYTRQANGNVVVAWKKVLRWATDNHLKYPTCVLTDDS